MTCVHHVPREFDVPISRLHYSPTANSPTLLQRLPYKWVNTIQSVDTNIIGGVPDRFFSNLSCSDVTKTGIRLPT
jgi:hypothetical protein